MSKPLRYLILHCTATKEGRPVTSKEIRKWHTAPRSQGGRGWKRVGYSDMIHLNGKIENLRKYNSNQIVEGWEITNGVRGINSESRHVVYVGGVNQEGKPKDTRTDAQLCIMEGYVKSFIVEHPQIQIAGHNQFANKACPSFNVPAWLREIGIPEQNIYGGN